MSGETPSFPSGARWIVSLVHDDPRHGRELVFVLPDGRRRRALIGFQHDTPALRAEIGEMLVEHRRFIRGVRIVDPPPDG